MRDPNRDCSDKARLIPNPKKSYEVINIYRDLLYRNRKVIHHLEENWPQNILYFINCNGKNHWYHISSTNYLLGVMLNTLQALPCLILKTTLFDE